MNAIIRKHGGPVSSFPGKEVLLELSKTKCTSEIAAMYHVTANSVLRWMKECGIQPSLRRPHKYPSDMDQLLEEYESCTAKDLAVKYDVKPATIRSWVRDARKKKLQ